MFCSFSMICFLNVSSEKFCTPRITCPLFLPLIALPLSPLHIVHLPTTHIPDLHQIHAGQHRLHAPLRQPIVIVLHVLRQRVARLLSTPSLIPTLAASLLRQRFVSGVRLHHSFTAYAFSSCGFSRFVCTPWTSVRTSSTCPSDSVNFRYRYMRLIFSGFYASPAEFERTSSGNGDGNSQAVTSDVMICLAKSRLMSVTSFLPITPPFHAYHKQLFLFSSSVGRSADVSFTEYWSNTPSRCEMNSPFSFLITSRSLPVTRFPRFPTSSAASGSPPSAGTAPRRWCRSARPWSSPAAR